jgi:putative Mg2+ transporter-C (MgtC) family protein
MTHDEFVIAVRLAVALVIGALIGLERSSHGRPAGFRTHSLVCLASALLMLLPVYQQKWMTEVPLEVLRTDPARMAQGIMTGIGFLGAGVIFKEGLTVRGLTTAGADTKKIGYEPKRARLPFQSAASRITGGEAMSKERLRVVA